MEERLRLLVWLDKIVKGEYEPWTDQQGQTLFQLLEAATASSRLACIPPLIDRHVRNALAHGQPELIPDSSECRFHDQNKTVTWKMNEFFDKTKQLTLGTCALTELEAIMHMVQTQSLVATLWQRVEM
jgi:hypothetical protein